MIVYLLSGIFLALLLFGLYVVFRRTDPGDQRYLAAGLLLKLMAGWSLGLLYTYYYDHGDTWSYFDLSRQLWGDYRMGEVLSHFFDPSWLADALGIKPTQTRILDMARFSYLLGYFSFQNYYVISAYFSLVSFIAVWYFFRTARSYFMVSSFPLFLALMVWPSVVFWSSGLSKEALSMAALWFLTGWLFDSNRRGAGKLLLLLISTIVLWRLRYFYAAAFLPIWIGLFTFHLTGKSTKRTFGAITIAILGLVAVSLLHPNLYFQRIIQVLVDHYAEIKEATRKENLIELGEIESARDVVRVFPLAIVKGLFYPLPWQEGIWLKQLAAVVNLSLWILLAVNFYDKVRTKGFNVNYWLIASLIYIFALAGMLTIAVPNIGSLVRYRIGFWWILALLALWEHPWIKRIHKS